MSATIGVITFPGTLDDVDALRAVRLTGAEPVSLWHADEDPQRTLAGVDAVVIPGGFSYGDYLRAGAISRFAPMMTAVAKAAGGPEGSADGLPVLGICNGFQILTESHLLPGSMIKNDHLHFICRDQELTVENTDTAWTRDYERGQTITVPLKNQDGQYVADDATLDALEAAGALQQGHQLGLVGAADRLLLVLQAVARAHIDDLDACGVFHSCLLAINSPYSGRPDL